MSLHKEISFENEICQHLSQTGWMYTEGDAAGYDRARALFPADVLAWVQFYSFALLDRDMTKLLLDSCQILPKPLFFGHDHHEYFFT